MSQHEWINITVNIEKSYQKLLKHGFLGHTTKDIVMSHKISGRPSESVRANIFTINKKPYI